MPSILPLVGFIVVYFDVFGVAIKGLVVHPTRDEARAMARVALLSGRHPVFGALDAKKGPARVVPADQATAFVKDHNARREERISALDGR